MKFVKMLFPKAGSTKSVAISGSLWTILGYGSSQVFRFASNLILTRLLYPELFGLMALLNTFVMGLWLFSDIGVGPSIIQNKRGDDPDFFNTAWTMQVIRGILLWLCTLVIAQPLAIWYEEPRLVWLIPIVGLTTISLGFRSTTLHLLKRNVDIGKVTLFELGTQIIAISITLLWAWIHPSIFALVGGKLLGSFIQAILSHVLFPQFKHKLYWSRENAQKIFSFGKWIFISTLMTFLASQFDKLMLPKLVSFEMLGIYTIAITLADIPRVTSQRLSQQVLFPILSKKSHVSRSDLRTFIEKKRFLLLVLCAVFLSTLSGFGDLLILNLYDDNYVDASWMFPILALGVWPNVIYVTYNSSLLAIGQSVYGAWGQFFKLLYMILIIPLGFSQLGIVGIILVVAFNDISLYAVSLHGVVREKLAFFKQDLLSTLILLILIFLIFQIRSLLGIEMPLFQ